MAKIWADRVAETSTTTGTGDFTLVGAVTGFQAFSAVCATNDVVEYMIEAVDASGAPTGDWEVGYGTYSAANTLTRTLVRASTNAGAAVSFAAGTKNVTLVVPASRARPRGALVKKSANHTTANYSAGVMMTFDTEVRDTDAIFDSAVDSTKLFAPVGVKLVRVRARLYIDNFSSGNAYWELLKTGSNSFAGSAIDIRPHNSTENTLYVETAAIDVVGGTDYFQVRLTTPSDSSITVYAAWTWFEMEIID